MSETTPPLSLKTEETVPDKHPSSWVMVITMLLMIAGFLLTSATMLHHAASGKGEGEEGQPFMRSLAALLEKGKAWSAEAGSGLKQEQGEGSVAGSQDSVVKKLFSGKEDGSVRWPKLKLTGFGRSADKDGAFAIINGKHVLVNTFIGDVKLVEVRNHGAVVEYRGEQKLITVEQPR